MHETPGSSRGLVRGLVRRVPERRCVDVHQSCTTQTTNHLHPSPPTVVSLSPTPVRRRTSVVCPAGVRHPSSVSSRPRKFHRWTPVVTHRAPLGCPPLSPLSPIPSPDSSPLWAGHWSTETDVPPCLDSGGADDEKYFSGKESPTVGSFFVTENRGDVARPSESGSSGEGCPRDVRDLVPSGSRSPPPRVDGRTPEPRWVDTEVGRCTGEIDAKLEPRV